ncbi:MAG TPA: hypothetical protein VK762_20525 [Polyangiaceae bacterium]|nr:hypothetical protein [Polyangiaceae bacterium]
MVSAAHALTLVLPACVFLFALATFGCSQGPNAVSPAHRTPAAVARAHTLVWATPTEEGTPVTYALGDDGETLSQHEGIRLWASGTEWTCEVSAPSIPTRACEDGAERPAQEGQGVRVRLVPSGPSRSALEIVSPASGDEANEIQQSARLLASIGPYVFVEDSTFTYTCGAHGNTGVSFAVWNLDEGRPVDLLSELPDREHVLASGKSVIDAVPDAIDFSRPEDPPVVTELLPRIGPHGRLETTALVTVASCYACTAGGWSSYTVSAQVPVPLPWRLHGLGDPPRAVGLFAEAHPGLTVGGYSVIP